MTSDPHAVGRQLYEQYLAKVEVLIKLHAHAQAVADATGGSSMTPVEPLATMGPGGGPLRCDVCRMPMILEGGGYQGVYTDDGWRRNPKKGWVSYISGGMLLVFESNGTLRVYHGHPHGDGCVGKGDRMLDEARAAFVQDPQAMEKLEQVEMYLRDVRLVDASDEVLSQIYKTLFKFDPGPGVNVLQGDDDGTQHDAQEV